MARRHVDLAGHCAVFVKWAVRTAVDEEGSLDAATVVGNRASQNSSGSDASDQESHCAVFVKWAVRTAVDAERSPGAAAVVGVSLDLEDFYYKWFGRREPLKASRVTASYAASGA